jgi:hypothetical protein
MYTYHANCHLIEDLLLAMAQPWTDSNVAWSHSDALRSNKSVFLIGIVKVS